MRMAQSGLKPIRFNSTILKLSPGSVFNAAGTKCIDNPSYYVIDLTKEGIGGWDRKAGVLDGARLHLFVLYGPNDEFGALLSRGYSYSEVTVPEGWTLHRKLQFGFTYRNAWDGIPQFETIGGPFFPLITLTGAQKSDAFSLCETNWAPQDWSRVQIDHLLPDSARGVLIALSVSTPTIGTVFIRTHEDVNPTGLPFAGGAGGLYTAYPPPIHIPHEGFQIKCTGGARVYGMWLTGYVMTEPS